MQISFFMFVKALKVNVGNSYTGKCLSCAEYEVCEIHMTVLLLTNDKQM